MKVLKLNQEILTALWILPVPDYETKWIKLRNTAISFTFFLLEFTMVISSVCFIYEYINVDVELSLYALLQLSAQSSQVYMLLFGIARRHKLAEVYSNIQQIYDESKCKPNSFSKKLKKRKKKQLNSRKTITQTLGGS